ncbi:MAG: hypothetical protein IJR89_00895 [Clostridia bacterium]|nr:hypothetical protein [Clostridia bacterium]
MTEKTPPPSFFGMPENKKRASDPAGSKTPLPLTHPIIDPPFRFVKTFFAIFPEKSCGIGVLFFVSY